MTRFQCWISPDLVQRVMSRGSGTGGVYERLKYGLNSFKLGCIMFGKDAVAGEVNELERVV